jgi:hypothetical protein
MRKEMAMFYTRTVCLVAAGVLSVLLLAGQPAQAQTISQWAENVLGYSTQYNAGSYSAAQALGPPDTMLYGDYPTAWTASSENGTQEYLAVGFLDPVYATGVTIRETYGNGFVTKVDVIDASDALHTVWTGTDPSQPGAPVDFAVTWTKTAYLVKGVRIYVNTDHTTGWEEVDAVRLYGDPPPGVSGTILLQATPNLTAPLTFEFRPTGGGTALTRTFTLGEDGSFAIGDIPADDYNLAVKGSMWLRKVVPADASGGSAYGIVATLLTGDVNNDNNINILDLGLLADSFGRSQGQTGYNANADLNRDGMIDILDLGLLADNFGKTGDP